jgi:hypothetical protein
LRPANAQARSNRDVVLYASLGPCLSQEPGISQHFFLIPMLAFVVFGMRWRLGFFGIFLHPVEFISRWNACMGNGDSLPHGPLHSNIHQILSDRAQNALNHNSIRIELFEPIPRIPSTYSRSLCVLNRFLCRVGLKPLVSNGESYKANHAARQK